MEMKKLTTVNVKNLTRDELEIAYQKLLIVSQMKSNLIESLTGIKNDPRIKAIEKD